MWRSTYRGGYRIVPINPSATEILGERSWPSLIEAAKHPALTWWMCFATALPCRPLPTKRLPSAPDLWLQIGVCHDEALAKAQAAGLKVVQDRCTLVEHQRLRSAGLLATAHPNETGA